MPREDRGLATDMTWMPTVTQERAPLFGPGQPLAPFHPGEPPRVFQYRPGVNLTSVPRAGFGLAPFTMLRALAAACKEVRLNIELIKREIRALEWDIVPVDNDAPVDGLDQVKAFFESPDGLHEFDAWANMILEEILCTDALTLWPEQDRGGRLLAMEVVDGATMRPLLDERGRVNAPPTPAYMQMIHGLPWAWFARDRLIYRPFNASVVSPYGASPIEFIILAVNMALRRDTFKVARFTRGNVPAAFLGIPSQYTPQQFQEYWDYISGQLEGNEEKRAQVIPIPKDGSSGGIPIHEFNQADLESTGYDQWLMQIACWAFGNSPAEFGLLPGEGLGGQGFVAGMENVQYRSVLGPVTQFLERLFNRVIAGQFFQPNLRFIWMGMEPQEDKLQQAQVDQIYIASGVYGVEYVQERLGVLPEMRPAPGALLPMAAPVALPLGFGFSAGVGEALPQGFFRSATDNAGWRYSSTGSECYP